MDLNRADRAIGKKEEPSRSNMEPQDGATLAECVGVLLKTRAVFKELGFASHAKLSSIVASYASECVTVLCACTPLDPPALEWK